MPEGDTIFRTARTLHRALGGQTVTRFETVLPKLARVADALGIGFTAHTVFCYWELCSERELVTTRGCCYMRRRT